MNRLPQLDGDLFISDGGLETALIYLQGVELPLFAAFPLLDSEKGRAELTRYYTPFLEIAKSRGLGFVLDTPTWRANPDWAAQLGYDLPRLMDLNKRSVAFMRELAVSYVRAGTRIVVSGIVGPRGDGYRPGQLMNIADARAYHAPQVQALKDGGADFVAAVTMNYPAEGAGIAIAAKEAGIPSVVSFTLETDGRLATGDVLAHAIDIVETATDRSPAYYMINCVHPLHFADRLPEKADWLNRVRGIRANASTRSHAELDAATDLDAGYPRDLAQRYRALRGRFGSINVLGGCCGTDHRHIDAIAEAATAK
jgi:homocysteine S-methyltransferase